MKYNKTFKTEEEGALTGAENEPLVIDLHYLPCVAYMQLLAGFEEVIFDIHEYYEKQSYRNRCYINGANHIQRLIVPVSKDQTKTPVKDLRIDYSENWLHQHWRSITSVYGNAPFFDFLSEEFLGIYNKRHKFLVDLNYELLTKCLHLLNVNAKLSFSKYYIEKGIKNVRNYKNVIHPKNSNKISAKPYIQTFGKDFVPNLSVLDLLFCEGQNGRKYIME